MPENSIVHRMTAYMAWADDVALSYAETFSKAKLSAPRETLFKTITGALSKRSSIPYGQKAQRET